MGRGRRVLAVAVLASVLLSAPVGRGVAAPAEKVFVQRIPGAQQTLYYRPHIFYLSADGALTVTGVKWRAYGGASATATAVAHTNDCEPFCLAGTFSTHPAKLRLTGRIYCRARGREIYTQLSVHILGHIPKNFGNGHESLSMRPVDGAGDPLC